MNGKTIRRSNVGMGQLHNRTQLGLEYDPLSGKVEIKGTESRKNKPLNVIIHSDSHNKMASEDVRAARIARQNQRARDNVLLEDSEPSEEELQIMKECEAQFEAVPSLRDYLPGYSGSNFNVLEVVDYLCEQYLNALKNKPFEEYGNAISQTALGSSYYVTFSAENFQKYAKAAVPADFAILEQSVIELLQGCDDSYNIFRTCQNRRITVDRKYQFIEDIADMHMTDRLYRENPDYNF